MSSFASSGTTLSCGTIAIGFEDAAFHIDRAMLFINRFVKDELGLDLDDHIPSEYIDQILSP